MVCEHLGQLPSSATFIDLAAGEPRRRRRKRCILQQSGKLLRRPRRRAITIAQRAVCHAHFSNGHVAGVQLRDKLSVFNF